MLARHLYELSCVEEGAASHRAIIQARKDADRGMPALQFLTSAGDRKRRKSAEAVDRLARLLETVYQRLNDELRKKIVAVL
jgi:hypothetical protein